MLKSEAPDAVKTETAGIIEPHDGARWWTWLLKSKSWPAVTARVSLALFAVVFVFLAVEYLHFANIADRRLAEGPFSTTTDIYAGPEVIGVGDTLSLDELASKLAGLGYTRSPKNPGGWFETRGSSLQISPGPGTNQEPVRIEFGHGKVSAIERLPNHDAIEQYELAPRLLTNLSGSREKRRLVHFSEIPHSLVQALTSAEDKRFFQHGGFDYRRMVKAAIVDFRDGRKQQGASTLSMQLARALWLEPNKAWRRKVEEILITLHLEHRLTKQQIFEDYANQIYFGRRGSYSINGFGEAARLYFGKELWQIDLPEAALLAGLVQRPSYYNPFHNPERAIARRNVVLALMRRNGQIDDNAYRKAVATELHLAPPAADESENSYFISMMNDELQSTLGESAKQSRTVVTTLDPDLQRAAEAAVRSGMDFVDQQLHKRNTGDKSGVRPQVALIALNPHTGAIKALVGGRDYGDSQLNHVVAMRQPGSVFKPFVYAAAIDTGLNGGAKTFTPASMLNDEATTFFFQGNAYQPKDFKGEYEGDVTLRTALAHSLNVATVSLAEQVGYQRVVALARRAGLNDDIKATPSVALGAYETTPLEIATAYTAFANQGAWVKPTTIEAVRSDDGMVLSQHQVQSHPALDPRVAYIITNMMQEVLRSGTGASVRSRGFLLPAAGKTGTSHDGWFAGFTSELLCVVWVGFDDNRELNLEGARSALPIWAEFMKRAAQIRPYNQARDFRAPSGIVATQICSDSGELAGSNCPHVRTEVFIAGTEPTSICSGHPPTIVSDAGDGGNR